MNIVQLHERVRFWVDIVASTRLDSQDIDNGLNIAIDNKILETYDQSRPMNRSDAFQRTQRCRDILGSIVAKAINNSPAGFTLSSNTITIANTTDYQYLLSLGIKIGSTVYECLPLTYDKKNVLYKNPFRKPRMTPTVRMYYNELAGNIVITHAYTSSLTDFELYYLRIPATVNYGIEYASSHNFSVGNIVIAVEETVYNSITYTIGSPITIVTNHLSITSGKVIYGYTSCDLRSSTHEEISRRTAINCLMATGQDAKAKLLREEITAS